MIITLNSLFGKLFSPFHLVFLLGFDLIPSIGTYFSVPSFFLIVSFYFYIFGRLVLFLDLGVMVFGRRQSMYPRSPLSSCHRGICSSVATMGTMWSPLLRQADWCGQPSRHGWPLVCLVARPAIVWGSFLTQLVSGSRVSWIKSSPSLLEIQLLSGPGSGAVLLVGGLGPDMAGCRATVDRELLPFHCWLQPNPGHPGYRACVPGMGASYLVGGGSPRVSDCQPWVCWSWCQPTGGWGRAWTSGCRAEGLRACAGTLGGGAPSWAPWCQGWVLCRWGTLRVLMQMACWWVGLWSCSPICLVGVFPVLMPTSCLVGLRRLAKWEGGFQNGTCQHPCPLVERVPSSSCHQ